MTSTYLNPRLQEKTRQINQYPLVTFIAPLGYGKKTYLTYLKKNAPYKKENIWHYKATTPDVNSLKKELTHYCRQHFPGEFLMTLPYFPPLSSLSLTPHLFIVENCHLFSQKEFSMLLSQWLTWLPENCQLWLTGTSLFLTPQQKLSLGKNWLTFTKDDFILQPADISEYAKSFQLTLEKKWCEDIFHFTAGWFAPLHDLFFRWQQKKQMPSFLPFQKYLKSYLATQETFPKELFYLLTLQKALPLESIISLLQISSATLVKECEKICFLTYCEKTRCLYLHPFLREHPLFFAEFFPQKVRQEKLQQTLGAWCEENGYFCEAFFHYLQQEELPALTHLVTTHQEQILSGKMRQMFHQWFYSLSQTTLLKNQKLGLTTLFFLVLFEEKKAYHQLKKQLLPPLNELPSPQKEKYLSEYYFILSLSSYGNLKEMLSFQQLALKYLNHHETIPPYFYLWSFGAPSLMMLLDHKDTPLEKTYHHFSSYLTKIPSPYQTGKAAQLLAKAELLFLKGKWVAMELSLQQGLYLAHQAQNSQLLICGYFLKKRKELLQGKNQHLEISPFSLPKITPLQEQSYLLANSLLNIYQKKYSQLPHWLKTGDFSKLELFEPSLPQAFVIHLEYLLSCGYTDLILAKEDEIRNILFESSLLNRLYGKIILSAAYLKGGLYQQGLPHFQEALLLGQMDQLMTPFVENYDFLKAYLQQEEIPFYLRSLDSKKKRMPSSLVKSPWLSNYTLTKVEQDILQLAQRNLSNKEIATSLFLAEGTVKQYFNRIYGKFQIKGGGKNKRDLLLKRLQENY